MSNSASEQSHSKRDIREPRKHNNGRFNSKDGEEYISPGIRMMAHGVGIKPVGPKIRPDIEVPQITQKEIQKVLDLDIQNDQHLFDFMTNFNTDADKSETLYLNVILEKIHLITQTNVDMFLDLMFKSACQFMFMDLVIRILKRIISVEMIEAALIKYINNLDDESFQANETLALFLGKIMGMHWKIPRKIGLNHTNNFNFACKAIIANWILAIENDCIIEHENADLIVDAKLVSKANDACLNLLSWVSSGYHTLMMNDHELVDRVYAAALDTLTDKNTISEEAASALYLILQEMSFDKKTKTYKKTSGTQITVDA